MLCWTTLWRGGHYENRVYQRVRRTVGDADESFIQAGRIGHLHRGGDCRPRSGAPETQPFGLVTFSMFGSGAYGPQGALGKKKTQCPVSSTDGRRGRSVRAGFPLRAVRAIASGRMGVFRCPTPPYGASWVSVATVPSVAVGRLHRCLDLRSPRFPQRIVLGHKHLEQSMCLLIE